MMIGRRELTWLLLCAVFTLAHSRCHQLEILARRRRHLGRICSHVAILGRSIVLLVEDWTLLDALVWCVDELLLWHYIIRHILAAHKLVGLREHLGILLVLHLLRILHGLLRNILRIEDLLTRLVLDLLVWHLRLDRELVLLLLVAMLRSPKELLRVRLLLGICLLLLKGLLAVLIRRSVSVIRYLTIAR